MNTDSTRSPLSSFAQFISENTLRASRRRSWVGLLITVILLPLLVGVLACMPVPVGDPEKSRIDPAMSGVWISNGEDQFPLMVLDPYDKRTWLVSWIGLGEKTPAATEQNDEAVINKEISIASIIDSFHKNQYFADGIVLFKGWLIKIKGEQFLTLEPKTSEPGLTPEYWWVFRVRLDDGNRLQLLGVDENFEGLKGVETSAKAEKIIRRNLNNPELFGDPLDFHKVSPDDLEAVNKVIGELWDW